MENQEKNNIVMKKKKNFSSLFLIIIQTLVIIFFIITWSNFIKPIEFFGYFLGIGTMSLLGFIGVVVGIRNFIKKITIFLSTLLILTSLFSIFGFGFIEMLSIEFNGDAERLRHKESYIQELNKQYGFPELLEE